MADPYHPVTLMRLLQKPNGRHRMKNLLTVVCFSKEIVSFLATLSLRVNVVSIKLRFTSFVQ